MLHPLPRSYNTPSGCAVYPPFLDWAAKPHLLIAGATGSGKSVLVNGIITSLLMTQSPARCLFVLIDPKKVELSDYRSIPHVARYASEPADMIRSISWAVEETDRRFSVMQAQGVKEYAGPHLYVIIDELADLMTMHKKESLPLLQRLAQVGRAARVHLIACTQNVMAVTIPTVLKCNFSTVIGLRTATRSQSRMLIDAPGCETLPDPKREGKGYAFIRDGADLDHKLIYKYDDTVLPSLVRFWTSSACIAS